MNGRLLSFGDGHGGIMGGPLLETLDLGKIYGATVAADQVSISLEAGRVHALVGENGAGKSTVIKMDRPSAPNERSPAVAR